MAKEINSVTFNIQHEESNSLSQVKCALDENKNAKLVSVSFISGNVISLELIKKALVLTKETLNK